MQKQSHRLSTFVSRSRKFYRRPRKAVEFAVAENREIPLGNIPTMWNSTEQLAILWEDSLLRAEMGLIDSKLQWKSRGGGSAWRKLREGW